MGKRRNKDIRWYAFYQDFNKDHLVYMNVIGSDLIEDILKRVKSKREDRKIDSYVKLVKVVENYLICHYFSKTEYEVLVTNWSGADMEQKIDIWFQLAPNLDRIVEYINRELQLGLEL